MMLFDPVLNPINSGVVIRRFRWSISGTPSYDSFPTLKIKADPTQVYSIVAMFGSDSVTISGGYFDTTGVFTYSDSALLLEIERPTKFIHDGNDGLLCTLDPSVMSFVTDVDIPSTDLTLKLNKPLSYQLSGDTLILGLEHVNPDNKMVSQEGLLQINGVVPDAYGNINIKSIIPSISVRVYAPDDSSSGE